MVNPAAPVAFLFPGQGSQRPGMLARLRHDPIGAATSAEAQSILGCDLAGLDTDQALAGTEAAQLAMLISGVACARMLEREGITANYLAGHSVGAFAAATHAGVLSFPDALRLVALRGRTMAQTHPRGFGMAAIVGVPEVTLHSWIDMARTRGAVLHLANSNAPRQFTVSGTDADLARLIDHARTHGASKAVRLPVAAPSHSPLMTEVAATMHTALQSIVLHAPRLPCASNHTARILHDAPAIAHDLAESVAQPVRWHEILQAMHERGVSIFVEMQPGDVLTKLVQTSFDQVRAFALESTTIAALNRFVSHRTAIDP